MKMLDAIVRRPYRPSVPRTEAQVACPCETVIEYPVNSDRFDPTHEWVEQVCRDCGYIEVGRYVRVQDRPDMGT